LTQRVVCATYVGVGKAVFLLVRRSSFADPDEAVAGRVQHKHVLHRRKCVSIV